MDGRVSPKFPFECSHAGEVREYIREFVYQEQGRLRHSLYPTQETLGVFGHSTKGDKCILVEVFCQNEDVFDYAIDAFCAEQDDKDIVVLLPCSIPYIQWFAKRASMLSLLPCIRQMEDQMTDHDDTLEFEVNYRGDRVSYHVGDRTILSPCFHSNRGAYDKLHDIRVHTAYEYESGILRVEDFQFRVERGVPDVLIVRRAAGASFVPCLQFPTRPVTHFRLFRTAMDFFASELIQVDGDVVTLSDGVHRYDLSRIDVSDQARYIDGQRFQTHWHEECFSDTCFKIRENVFVFNRGRKYLHGSISCEAGDWCADPGSTTSASVRAPSVSQGWVSEETSSESKRKKKTKKKRGLSEEYVWTVEEVNAQSFQDVRANVRGLAKGECLNDGMVQYEHLCHRFFGCSFARLSRYASPTQVHSNPVLEAFLLSHLEDRIHLPQDMWSAIHCVPGDVVRITVTTLTALWSGTAKSKQERLLALQTLFEKHDVRWYVKVLNGTIRMEIEPSKVMDMSVIKSSLMEKNDVDVTEEQRFVYFKCVRDNIPYSLTTCDQYAHLLEQSLLTYLLPKDFHRKEFLFFLPPDHWLEATRQDDRYVISRFTVPCSKRFQTYFEFDITLDALEENDLVTMDGAYYIKEQALLSSWTKRNKSDRFKSHFSYLAFKTTNQQHNPSYYLCYYVYIPLSECMPNNIQNVRDKKAELQWDYRDKSYQFRGWIINSLEMLYGHRATMEIQNPDTLEMKHLVFPTYDLEQVCEDWRREHWPEGTVPLLNGSLITDMRSHLDTEIYYEEQDTRKVYKFKLKGQYSVSVELLDTLDESPSPLEVVEMKGYRFSNYVCDHVHMKRNILVREHTQFEHKWFFEDDSHFNLDDKCIMLNKQNCSDLKDIFNKGKDAKSVEAFWSKADIFVYLFNVDSGIRMSCEIQAIRRSSDGLKSFSLNKIKKEWQDALLQINARICSTYLDKYPVTCYQFTLRSRTTNKRIMASFMTEIETVHRNTCVKRWYSFGTMALRDRKVHGRVESKVPFMEEADVFSGADLSHVYLSFMRRLTKHFGNIHFVPKRFSPSGNSSCLLRGHSAYLEVSGSDRREPFHVSVFKWDNMFKDDQYLQVRDGYLIHVSDGRRNFFRICNDQVQPLVEMQFRESCHSVPDQRRILKVHTHDARDDIDYSIEDVMQYRTHSSHAELSNPDAIDMQELARFGSQDICLPSLRSILTQNIFTFFTDEHHAVFCWLDAPDPSVQSFCHALRRGLSEVVVLETLYMSLVRFQTLVETFDIDKNKVAVLPSGISLIQKWKVSSYTFFKCYRPDEEFIPDQAFDVEGDHVIYNGERIHIPYSVTCRTDVEQTLDLLDTPHEALRPEDVSFAGRTYHRETENTSHRSQHDWLRLLGW